MNPILLALSYVFGLIPFNRQDDKSAQFLDYGVMLCMPLLYLGCYALANFAGFAVYSLPDCGSICSLGNTLFLHVGCFLYATTVCLTLYRRKKFFVQFERSLRDIDERLLACHEVAEDKMKLPPNRHVYYLTWLLVACIFGYAIFYDVTEMIQYYRGYFFVANMTVTFPFFAGSVAQAQFIYFVSAITERFTDLNGLFGKINQECEKKNAPVVVFDIEDNVDGKELKGPKEKSLPGTMGADHLKEKSLGEGEFSDDNNSEDSDAEGVVGQQMSPTSEANLPELFKLHDKILELSVLTSDEFGPQCVPYMAATFIISIFGIFLETKVIFIVGGKSPLLDYVAMIYLIWSLTAIMVAYLVLRLCCNANGFSKQSAMIVHEIMQKKPVFMLGDDLYYNKMKSFTLQFLHWEGYFQFNGIGLFVLDYTFIFSTVSAATSYLIVLLQFDMSAILKAEGLT